MEVKRSRNFKKLDKKREYKKKPNDNTTMFLSFIGILALIAALTAILEYIIARFNISPWTLIISAGLIVNKIIRKTINTVSYIEFFEAHFPVFRKWSHKLKKFMTEQSDNIKNVIKTSRSYERWRKGFLSVILPVFRCTGTALCFAVIFAFLRPVGYFLSLNQEAVNVLIAGKTTSYTDESTPVTVSSTDLDILFPKGTFRLDPPNAKFHLENFYENYQLTEDEYAEVFFTNYGIDFENHLKAASIVDSRIAELMDEKRPNGIYSADEIVKSRIYDIAKRENNFHNRIRAQTLPLESSATLEQIIEDWTELDENNKAQTIYWLLANAYQEFAIEFYNQAGGSSANAKYYYMKSIIACIDALKYQEDVDGKSRIILKYISGRYKDLADTLTIMTPEEITAATELSIIFEQASQEA